MSSIGEAKARIKEGSGLADEVGNILTAARAAVEQALVEVKHASDGTKHSKILEALTAYGKASAELQESVDLIREGQEAANEYATRLG
jgi:hypothetical protein